MLNKRPIGLLSPKIMAVPFIPLAAVPLVLATLAPLVLATLAPLAMDHGEQDADPLLRLIY